MEIKIAGCRGSLPSPSGKTLAGKDFKTEEFGGNTTCIYIESEKGEKIILDAGSGIMPLGKYLLDSKKGNEFDINITHTHWDHIQGFPFFIPAYIKGNKINIYGEAKVTGNLIKTIENTDPKEICRVIQVNGCGMREVLARQQDPRNFPAPLEYMNGIENFYDFIPGGLVKHKNDLKIESQSLNHPGGCVSYKYIENGKILVVSTDFEPDTDQIKEDIIKWWSNADIVIADGQYETGSSSNPFMKGYGHSDPFIDVDLAKQALVKKLIITHHDPKCDDTYLRDLEKRVMEYSKKKNGPKIAFAREGRDYYLSK